MYDDELDRSDMKDILHSPPWESHVGSYSLNRAIPLLFQDREKQEHGLNGGRAAGSCGRREGVDGSWKTVICDMPATQLGTLWRAGAEKADRRR